MPNNFFEQLLPESSSTCYPCLTTSSCVCYLLPVAASYLLPPSCLLPATSYLLPATSFLPPTSYLLPPSCLLPSTCYLLPASYLLPLSCSSCVCYLLPTCGWSRTSACVCYLLPVAGRELLPVSATSYLWLIANFCLCLLPPTCG